MAQQTAIRERAAAERTVVGKIAYFGGAPAKPTFHAQDHGRDNWTPDVREIRFHDARGRADPPSLDREGIVLTAHKTAIKDFSNPGEVRDRYNRELEELIRTLTGAVKVVSLAGGHMRFSARHPKYKTGINTQPAHFPHVDFTAKSGPGLVSGGLFTKKAEELKPGQRLVGYSVWRVVSEPPQDVPLAVCDVRSVAWDDLVAADGIYDFGEPPWHSAEAYMIKYNLNHRWMYFADMRPDEALVFRTHESGVGTRPGVPHCAFDDPSCPPEAGGRVSVESRVYAVFEE